MNEKQKFLFGQLKTKLLLLIFFLSLIPIPLLMQEAPAAETTLTPFLGLRATYDDNIDFSHENKRDDYYFTISPGLRLDYKTERTMLSALARVDINRYMDETDENATNQTYAVNVSHQLMEKLSVRANAGYVRDTTTDSQLEETGAVSDTRSTVHSYRGGAGLTYNLTEVSDIGVDYAHTKVDYDDEDKVDHDSDSVIFAYHHAFFDRRDILTVAPSYTRNDSDTSTVDTYGLSVGLTHRFSETLLLGVTVGGRYSDAEYHDTDTTDDHWNWTADIYATRTWETGSATIGYSRAPYFDDRGVLINVDRFYARANKNITEKFGVSLTGSIYWTKTDNDDVEERDERYYTISPSLYYNITQNHKIEVGYTYANDYDKVREDNQTAERNMFWILLTLNFPYNW
jgi:hypothetical protein